MRGRLLCVVAVIVAAALLSSCRTHVGVAASVDGHRITETQVNDYVPSSAQAVTVRQSNGSTLSIPPRAFVLNILIKERLFSKILAKTPAKAPTDGQLQAAVSQYLGGKTMKQAAQQLAAPGFTKEFDRRIVETQVLATQLNDLFQRGVNLDAIVKKLNFPVSVNPRYGKWDARALNMSAKSNAGLPDFVRLQPSPSTTPDVPTTPNR